MIVRAVLPMAIIRRRSYDSAKFHTGQTFDYLVSVTIDYPKGSVVQLQNKKQLGWLLTLSLPSGGLGTLTHCDSSCCPVVNAANEVKVLLEHRAAFLNTK